MVYLFGNPLSVIGLLGVLVFFAYAWWRGGVSLWAPFLTLLAFSYAMGASDKLAKYNRWKREWKALK